MGSNQRGEVPRFLVIAIQTCLAAHGDQVDKGGKPYFLHPLRVMAALGPNEDPEVQAAAVLHDVVEDTGLSLADLEVAMPPRTVELVSLLTHPSGEEYLAYVRRIRDCGDDGAKRIKRADLADNMRPDRWKPGMKKNLVYLHALAILDGREQ